MAQRFFFHHGGTAETMISKNGYLLTLCIYSG